MLASFTQNLSDWLSESDAELNSLHADVEVAGVCQDSRLCVAGDAYLALKGATTHGYQFALSAIEQGAVAVLVSADAVAEHPGITEQLQQKNIPLVLCTDLDNQASQLAAKFYQDPSASLSIIAVTGTDGKTSVCQFVTQAFTDVGVSCGYIGTLGWGCKDVTGTTALTTPDAVALQRILATMQQAGATAVAMEASSHGIAEGRLNDIKLDVAVLTNLGRDHLDYHASEAAYADAKAALFRWPSLKAIVVNGDDELGRSLIRETVAAGLLDVHVFSKAASNDQSHNSGVDPEVDLELNPALKAVHNYTAKSITLNKAGLNFELIDGDETHEIFSPLYGRFNVDNMCACYAVLRASNVSSIDSADALQMLSRVPGRMEPFSEFAQPTLIVDYAHTPQALAAAIAAVREHARGSLWVVFGCGGDRDPGKRALMAQAAEAADEIIVTDDNPRTENAALIRLMIISGFSHPSVALEIGDRMKAIQYAIWHAQPDDVILVAGKGHEDYQIVGDQVLHFSDRDVAQRLLKEVV